MVVGNESCGKTSLINKYILKKSDGYPTSCMDFHIWEQKLYGDCMPYLSDTTKLTYMLDAKLYITDTSGNMLYRKIISQYVKSINIFILCFDNLDSVGEWLTYLRSICPDSVVYCVQTKMHNINTDYTEISEWIDSHTDTYFVGICDSEIDFFYDPLTNRQTNICGLFCYIVLHYISNKYNGVIEKVESEKEVERVESDNKVDNSQSNSCFECCYIL